MNFTDKRKRVVYILTSWLTACTFSTLILCFSRCWGRMWALQVYQWGGPHGTEKPQHWGHHPRQLRTASAPQGIRVIVRPRSRAQLWITCKYRPLNRVYCFLYSLVIKRGPAHLNTRMKMKMHLDHLQLFDWIVCMFYSMNNAPFKYMCFPF